MNQTELLFDPPTELRHPSQPRAGLHHKNANRSERESALNLLPKSGTRRMQVLRAIVNAPHGATRQEVSDSSGVTLQSVCARVAELRQAGFIEESETKQRQGRAVLFSTARGRRAVQR